MNLAIIDGLPGPLSRGNAPPARTAPDASSPNAAPFADGIGVIGPALGAVIRSRPRRTQPTQPATQTKGP